MNKSYLLYIVMLFSKIIYPGQPWTWLYSFNQSAEKNLDRVHNLSTPLFNHLIFSWNAMRPAQGYFSFWLQVREAKSQRWYDWHHMIDWGKDMQKSYRSVSQAAYEHVRLEMPSSLFANGFRIKVVAHDGASLSLLKHLNITIANLALFESEHLGKYALSCPLKSVKILQVPSYSQMTLEHPKYDSLCSPTSVSMLLGYLLNRVIDPVVVANQVYDNGLQVYGSWPFNTAIAYEYCQGLYNFYVTRLASFKEMHALLQKNLPVIVSVRGSLEGAPRVYTHGHLLVVVGWDSSHKKVLCHDPAFLTDQQVITSYTFDAFCTAWDRSKRLAYVAHPVKL